MKTPLINQLQPNVVYTTSFVVLHKDIRQKKTGEPYLSLILGDKTGELDGKMWDNVEEVMDTFERDDFVKVKGLLQIFHNRPQLTIHKMRRLEEHEIDFIDYFPSSERDPGEMWAELRGMISRMANPHLRGLLEALLDDPEIASRYRVSPAAKHIHHAYLGGLLEHVLSLANLARPVSAHYPEIDGDLLLAGVVLHDIGKIYELTYERGFGYSGEGQLLGHMAIALRMIADKLHGLPDFPPRLRSLIEHMVLSHHGQLEFGSPKLPQFPEAIALHYIDDLDSKLECMRASIKRDRLADGCFTGYVPSLERMVLKKDAYLDGPLPKPQRAAPQPAAAPPGASPPAVPCPAAPLPGPPPLAAAASRPVSPFAEKLQTALNPSEEKQ